MLTEGGTMLALGLALCPEGAVHVYSNNSYLLHRLSNEFNLNHARISQNKSETVMTQKNVHPYFYHHVFRHV